MTVEVRILRNEPEPGGLFHYQKFSVPLADGFVWTAMDLLDYIQGHLDPSLAYFRHSACGRGLCRRCAARINGRWELLCEHLVVPGDVLTLEPVSRRRVIRDLACRSPRDEF
ncbi:MAG: 2Fe-2S iron-sulfur cluster-binding protein [Desulfobacterales bacterium]|jgi:succinate dehydrogenase/fumarate reductase-like Fe-S protein